MTKSTITREQLLEIIETDHVQCGEASYLARMALAEKASEPVILYRERNPYNGLTTGWQELTENEFSFLKENAGENAEFLTLYRHAQPAPVVSADLLHSAASAIEDLLTTKDRTGAGVWFDLPFKLRSAANAQPVPVVPEEMTPQQASRSYGGEVRGYRDGWNACRAAMLNGGKS
ncbi:hypothetical protein [Klebsiella pneumoniae]|uniref:hypothetical protein n=1 Tax=Klebsiella pneumoniae TaxID=573 RepID=UPI000E2A6AD2|nr:hypothetical protein [Klebsiella pneumoniae]SXB70171.1 Uncharacterised protein [Klebsiella pneumoniae]